MEYPELVEMLPDGDSILDYIPDADPTRLYTCRFCGKTFRADGDEMSFVRYYQHYGCGCKSESEVDAIDERR